MLVGANGLIGRYAVILLLPISDITEYQTLHCQHHQKTHWGAYVGIENVTRRDKMMEDKYAVAYKEDIQLR